MHSIIINFLARITGLFTHRVPIKSVFPLGAAVLLLALLIALFNTTIAAHGAFVQRALPAQSVASIGELSPVDISSPVWLGTDQNPCPEGEFLALSDEDCYPLAKSYGFDLDEFSAAFGGAEYTLSVCTQSALRDLLLRAKQSGGTILLPACTIPITQSITIPSNTIFQGAGREQTIFEAQPGFTGNMLRSKQDANIIIRDLTVDGAGTDSTGILAWYVRNVLIERVHVLRNGGSGITFRYANKITIRYSESHDHIQYHGIGSKDCFPKDDTLLDIVECQEQAGDTSPGSLWSQDYAVYSNRLYNNGDYGINLHGSFGEVAGNQSENNAYGSKFPDGSHLWIHHNQMVGNELWGMYIYNTLDTSARIAGRSVVYENRLERNGNYPIRIHDPAYSVYLMRNTYDDNELNRLRILTEPVFICADTTEESMAVDGQLPQIAPLTECVIEGVSSLFPLSTIYLPLSIYE